MFFERLGKKVPTVAPGNKIEIGKGIPGGEDGPGVVLAKLREANGDEGALPSSFAWPGGPRLTYDVNAPKGTWVIESVDGQPVDRGYDAWPQVAGDVPDFTFERGAE